MATYSQESNIIKVYFKIPFSEITTICEIEDSLTISKFINYVNVEVRDKLNINERWYIEVVEAGNINGELALCMDPSDETLLQRYNNRSKAFLAYYARPVNPITREFVRNINYSD